MPGFFSACSNGNPVSGFIAVAFSFISAREHFSFLQRHVFLWLLQSFPVSYVYSSSANLLVSDTNSSSFFCAFPLSISSSASFTASCIGISLLHEGLRRHSDNSVSCRAFLSCKNFFRNFSILLRSSADQLFFGAAGHAELFRCDDVFLKRSVLDLADACRCA